MVVEELVAKIGLEFEGANKAIEAAHHISSIGAALLGVGSILLASKAAFEGLALSVAEEVEQLNDFGEAVGISVTAIQTLAAAAAPAGASVEDVETGLRKLADAAGNAAKGNEAMIATFQSIGVNATTANGKVKPMQQLLEEVGTGLANIEDPGLRVNAAIDLLGRGAVKLIPAMQSLGKEGFEALRKEGERLGVVMGEETVKQFAKAGESFNGLELRAKGFKNIIAKAFLPSLQKSLDALTKFYDANADKIEAVAKRVANVVTKPFALLSDVIGSVIDWLSRFWNLLDPVSQGILEISAALLGLGLAFLIPAAPILILTALVAAIGEDLYNFSKGLPSVTGDIVESFKQLGDGLENYARYGSDLEKVLSGIVLTTKDAIKVITSLFSLDPRKIRDAVGDIGDQVLGDQGSIDARHRRAADFSAFHKIANAGQTGGLTGPPGADFGNGMQQIGDQSSATVAPRASGSIAPIINQGSVSVSVTATPGMNEQELASKVAQAVNLEMSMQAEEVASAFGRTQ